MTAQLDPRSSPIFIVGAGRTGTTLLRLMLCAHPNIYISHEASFYVWESLYRRRADGMAFLRYYFQTFNFRWLQIDPIDVLAALPDSLRREKVGEAFRETMRVHAERFGRRRFGDKTPLHSAHLGRIFADFPDGKVIHIVRDPRGTVLSTSRVPWGSRSHLANASFWNATLRDVCSFSDRILEVRLEDLLTDSRASMERVLEYVGEPWDEAVLDHARHLPAGDNMPALPWLATATRVRGKPTAQWEEMSPVQIRAIELNCGKWMEKYDYHLADLPIEPGRIRVWWAALSGVPESLRFLWLYLRLAFHHMDARRFGDAESKRLFARLNPPFWDAYPDFELPEPPPLPSDWPK